MVTVGWRHASVWNHLISKIRRSCLICECTVCVCGAPFAYFLLGNTAVTPWSDGLHSTEVAVTHFISIDLQLRLPCHAGMFLHNHALATLILLLKGGVLPSAEIPGPV